MLLNFSGKIIEYFIKQRFEYIEDAALHPIQKQEHLLFSNLKSAENTTFGKAHHFEAINTIQTFQDQVPLSDYESLLPYFEEIAKGKADVLWPGKVDWFAKSSGTTSAKSKYIPLTQETLKGCHFKGGKDLLTLYQTHFPFQDIFSGKTLVMGGSHGLGEFSEQAHQGDLSAIIIEHLPLWVNRRQCPTKKTALLSDWETKLENMAEEASKEDIRSISAIPSWLIVLFRKILKNNDLKSISELWPNLELIMHGGVSLTPYREELERLIGKKVSYIEVFNASEGSFAIQDKPEHLGMLLMVDYGIFYEFIPMNSSENSVPLTLSEVELNTTYAMVISTNSGLWRYQLGDTIQFTTLKPFRIKIVGRTKQYINSFGEELMVHNAEKALELCCERLTCSVKEFTVGPRLLEAGSCGFHDWYIEFEHPPNQLVDFENDLDAILQELNSDYEAKRHKNYILKNLKIKSLKENTFYNWMKSKGKLGGQHKVPRLSNSSQFLDEIDAFLQDNISTKKP
ncbi:MAG: GH3 auxin-responsive promoter family protein [Flavobacteriales bacterium]